MSHVGFIFFRRFAITFTCLLFAANLSISELGIDEDIVFALFLVMFFLSAFLFYILFVRDKNKNKATKEV